MATPKTVAKSLRHLHRVHNSWRVVSRLHFGGQVAFGTLQRIARTDGDYFPKDPVLQHALLGTPLPAPEVKPKRTRIPRYGWLIDLPVRTVTAMLNNREPMP